MPKSIAPLLAFAATVSSKARVTIFMVLPFGFVSLSKIYLCSPSWIRRLDETIGGWGVRDAGVRIDPGVVSPTTPGVASPRADDIRVTISIGAKNAPNRLDTQQTVAPLSAACGLLPVLHHTTKLIQPTEQHSAASPCTTKKHAVRTCSVVRGKKE